MHVLIRDGLVDRDYIERYTVGLRRARERAQRMDAGSAPRATCGIARRADRGARARLRHDQARRDPRSTTACSASRAAATPCAPSPACRRWSARGAIPPAAPCSRRPARTRWTAQALERPDLIAGTPRTINMSAIGDALLDARDPPVKAIFVYNSNPVAVAPESAQGARGIRARGPVLRRARDLPDRHRRLRRHPAARHDAARAVRRAPLVRPPLRASSTSRRSRRWARRCRNTEVFRRLAARMGFAEPCFRETDEQMARAAFAATIRAMRGLDVRRADARRLRGG